MTEVYHSPRESEAPISSDTESTHSYLRSPAATSASIMSDDQHSTSNYDSISNATQYLSISRPLSRSSVTSGLSVTATKDGIEGKRVKRAGIPGYPLNLMNKMYANYVTRSNVPDTESEADEDDVVDSDGADIGSMDGVTSRNGGVMNSPMNDLDDKMSVESLKSVSVSSMLPQFSRAASPSQEMSDSEVYGEDTLEFDKRSNTDYKNFLRSEAAGDILDEESKKKDR